MATKPKAVKNESQEEPPVQKKVCVELERGSVSVSRDGLTFCISGKKRQVAKAVPNEPHI